jgi:hypothetical protein
VGNITPVNANKIDFAAITHVEKVAEPSEAYGAATVGHGRRFEVHFLLQGFGGLHVGFLRCHGGGDGHAGAACILSINRIRRVRE